MHITFGGGGGEESFSFSSVISHAFAQDSYGTAAE